MSLDRISNLIFDQPHLYHPRKAETFVHAFGPRLTGYQVALTNGMGGVDHTAFANGRPSAAIIGDGLGRAYDRKGYSTFDVVQGVAIIGVEGTLVQKGAWIGASSGETSYQGLQTQIARASGDHIKGVVFEVDSFGGQVNGAFETAAMIRKLSAQKPTIAILTDYAYSAAYLLASQARQIIVPQFGGAGSIGVVMLHADWSGNLEQDGIKVTLIHSGKHKVDGNPYEPLPAEVLARWQSQSDQIRDRFAEAVATGRGKRLSKAAALKTEAEAFTASEAVELGLADAVGDPLAAFDAFIKEVNRKA
ncbi:peptidase S49 [Youhaiella tibetensis]|uniref:S49 family peptidase n=1 Tax=Paradevosia tibetensis TaxID=1447062 RepID=A0A5B9DJ69_9HYPH|nr:S49 family peptidase [Youhaiella tibetensis]QEE18882.1 S49 family peptidase [Youhaiella tibetensis]GGF38325.1 peptidase S49 [Youhaiella tibetensis]